MRTHLITFESTATRSNNHLMRIKTMVKYSLQYFPFKARAEPMRLAFVQGQIPFTNVATSFDEFKAIKATLPSGQLPLLTIEHENGEKHSYSQSMAMLRFIGKMSKLYPEDAEAAMAVDEVLDLLFDMSRPIEMSVGGAQRSFVQDTPWSKDEVLAIRKRLLDKEKEGSIPFVSPELSYIHSHTILRANTYASSNLTFLIITYHVVLEYLRSKAKEEQIGLDCRRQCDNCRSSLASYFRLAQLWNP
jgi:hypothetical protein